MEKQAVSSASTTVWFRWLLLIQPSALVSEQAAPAAQRDAYRVYLVSAAIWGFVFFAEKPDALTLIGMALITIAGLLAAERNAEPVAIRETS